MPTKPRAGRKEAAAPDGPSLVVTPAAAAELRAALAEKGAGWAVRLFVGGGAHPEVGMSLDRPTARDTALEVDGVPIVLDGGSRPFLDDATIDFVRTDAGGGFRVTGPNTPAPPTAPAPGAEGEPPTTGSFEEMARARLKKVYDPEIPMNIVDLGLIYGLARAADGRASVRFTMTSPGCPVADLLVEQVRTAVADVPGTKEVEVEVVWDPPWSPEKMSEFARRQLGFA